MNEWQKQRNAEQAELVEKLSAIAAELGGTWTVETPHDHGARLVNADGVRIWVRRETYGANAGRLELSAGVPDGADYNAGDYGRDKRPEITVSPDRTPAAIARDMSRRLIPGAVDYWTAVADRIARRLEAHGAREKLARELADIMGGTAREWRDDWQAELPDALRQSTGTYTYGHMSPSYDGAHVSAELRNITPDQARELARLVAGWAR